MQIPGVSSTSDGHAVAASLVMTSFDIPLTGSMSTAGSLLDLRKDDERRNMHFHTKVIASQIIVKLFMC